MDKKSLRKDLLNQRKAIHQDERIVASKTIMKKTMPYLKNIKCVGIYVSDPYEVDTHEMIHELLKTHQVCCPLITGDGLMEFHQVHSFDDLKEQHYHLLEPITSQIIQPHQIDALIIPLVGFNRCKERIGQGKGYYDRYLQAYHGQRIGIAYAFQECEFKADSYDETLDILINENEII